MSPSTKHQNPEPSDDNQKSPTGGRGRWWGGIIGLILLVVIIAGGTIGIARYETQSQQEEREEAIEAQSQGEEEEPQCATLVKDTPYTSGDPLVDARLKHVLEEGDQEASDRIVEALSTTGKAPEDDPAWKEAVQAVEKAPLERDLSMNPNNDIMVTDGPKVTDLGLPYPEQLDAGLSLVSVVIGDQEGNELDVQDFVISVHDEGNGDEDRIMLPVTMPEGEEDAQIAIGSVAPVC